jgi:hypothetical protein
MSTRRSWSAEDLIPALNARPSRVSESRRNKNVLAGLDHPFGLLDHEAGDPHMAGDILVVAGEDHLAVDGPPHLGDLLSGSSISKTIM